MCVRCRIGGIIALIALWTVKNQMHIPRCVCEYNCYIVYCVAMYLKFRCPTCIYFECADHRIDGKEFIDLSEAEIKEIIPLIGIAKQIMRLQPKVIDSSVLYSEIMIYVYPTVENK